MKKGRKSRDTEAIERAAHIVDAMNDADIEPQLKAKMQSWFRSGVSDKEKQEAFVSYADKVEPYEGKLQGEALRRYNKLALRLNLRMRSEGKRLHVAANRVWRVAAVLIPFAVLLGTGYFLGWFGGADVKQHDVIIAEVFVPETVVEVYEGVQKDVALPDQTIVWVNSGSRLSYPEEFGDERRVELEGQAFFEVEHNEEKPFFVQTEHIEVKVLGTKFDVVAYPEKNISEVLLFEGSVEVFAGNSKETMFPGEKLTYDHLTGEMRLTAAPINSMPDWRSDKIAAVDKSLPELFRMIGNYYDKDIEFVADEFSEELFEISFGKENTPEQVIDILSRLSGGFRYELVGNNIQIQSLKSTDAERRN